MALIVGDALEEAVVGTGEVAGFPCGVGVGVLDELAIDEEPGLGGELGGPVHIVHGEEDGGAPLVEPGDEAGELGLVADIEVGGGFVEDEEGGGLGEGAGDGDALGFSAAQGGKRAISEGGEFGVGEGFGNGFVVGGGF